MIRSVARDAWRELYGAARAAARDARSSRAILANSGAVLLFGLLLAGAAFAVLVFLRYAKLYSTTCTTSSLRARAAGRR